MGFIKRLIIQRAETAEEALMQARATCSKKIADNDLVLSQQMAEMEQIVNQFNEADSRGDDLEANRHLDRIRIYKEFIGSLNRDKKSWNDLEMILFRINSLIYLLRQHGEYWTIVRALPYGKLKRENYSNDTVEPLKEVFNRIHEKLRRSAAQQARHNAEFAQDYQRVDRTYDIVDQMALAESGYDDSRAALREELRQARGSNGAGLEPVQPVESENRSDNDNINS